VSATGGFISFTQECSPYLTIKAFYVIADKKFYCFNFFSLLLLAFLAVPVISYSPAERNEEGNIRKKLKMEGSYFPSKTRARASNTCFRKA
jgi:hypothetical protein